MAAKKRAIVLKVTLLEVEPPVWRRFAVPATITLPRLHAVLQDVMGWCNGHLHGFRFSGGDYGPTDPDWPGETIEERGKRLSKLLRESDGRFLYDYDFGDGWEHRVDVVDNADVTSRAFDRLPVCLDGARACPPEDCGGPFGYADFLAAIRDPNHEEHAGLLEWCGGAFEPEKFDVAEVNRVLRYT